MASAAGCIALRPRITLRTRSPERRGREGRRMRRDGLTRAGHQPRPRAGAPRRRLGTVGDRGGRSGEARSVCAGSPRRAMRVGGGMR